MNDGPSDWQLAAYAELLMQVRVSVRRVWPVRSGRIGGLALAYLIAQGHGRLALFTGLRVTE